MIKISKYSAEVVWCGCVAPKAKNIRSLKSTMLELGWDGPLGDRHSGRTRAACVRVRDAHDEGVEIANVRQLSILSAEENAAIASDIGVQKLDPQWLGASLVVRGIPDFSHLPPSSRLQGPDGATVVIDMGNAPCLYPAREIESDEPGAGKLFKAAAQGRRGVTAWVERPGVFRPGDKLRLILPIQRPWSVD
jgi:MOSC domain-containing protein YiiM